MEKWNSRNLSGQSEGVKHGQARSDRKGSDLIANDFTVWDGGIVLSSLIGALLTPSSPANSSGSTTSPPRHTRLLDTETGKFLDMLRHTLQPGKSGPSRRVLELGTGVGVVGLSMAQLSGLQITMTDLAEAEDLVLRNTSVNTPLSPVLFRALNWDDLESAKGVREDAAGFDGEVDVLVMSDVTYNEDSHASLWRTIECLSSRETRIVFASKYRHASERSFIEQLKERYCVLAAVIVDGTSFAIEQDKSCGIGDIEVLILSVGNP